MPVDQYFSETSFNGGHENTVLAVLDGKIDAGVTWASGVGDYNDGYTSGNLHEMVRKGELDMHDLVQLWQSPLIPNGPLVVSNKLAPEWQTKLADFFNTIAATDKDCFAAIENGDFSGYVPVTADFYKPIIDARKAAIGG